MSAEADDLEDDEPCPYCGDGERVPASGYWRCPVCDAEWHDDQPDTSTDGEPMTNPSRHAELLDSAVKFGACRRCKCIACEDGYENHSHACTHKEGCIETQANWQAHRMFAVKLVNDLRDALTAETARHDAPIPMILFCPSCGLQHIDAPDEPPQFDNGMGARLGGDTWTNPPHRSHFCRTSDGGCGHIWRPTDVPTTGVAAIETKGSADSALTLNLRARHDALRAGVGAEIVRQVGYITDNKNEAATVARMLIVSRLRAAELAGLRERVASTGPGKFSAFLKAVKRFMEQEYMHAKAISDHYEAGGGIGEYSHSRDATDLAHADLMDFPAITAGLCAKELSYLQSALTAARTEAEGLREKLAEAGGLIEQLAALAHEDGGRSFPSPELCRAAAAWGKENSK